MNKDLPERHGDCQCICHIQDGIVHFAPCCRPEPETLINRVRYAMIGSCSCGTKTPDIGYHDPNCRYRVLFEVEGKLVELEKQALAADLDSWKTNPDRMGGQFTDDEINRDDWT